MEKPEWIAELKAEAERATPGPWQVGDHPSEVIAPCPCCGLIATCSQYGAMEEAWCYNSTYIALANPQKILELIDWAESLESEAARWRWVRQFINVIPNWSAPGGPILVGGGIAFIGEPDGPENTVEQLVDAAIAREKTDDHR